MPKKLTDYEKKLKKSRLWLNKNFRQGWGAKWRNEDEEVKALARIIKL